MTTQISFEAKFDWSDGREIGFGLATGEKKRFILGEKAKDNVARFKKGQVLYCELNESNVATYINDAAAERVKQGKPRLEETPKKEWIQKEKSILWMNQMNIAVQVVLAKSTAADPNAALEDIVNATKFLYDKSKKYIDEG
jgi:hypothetical protein